MSEFALEGPELKKMVKLSRKQPLPFAFNPGKSDDDHYFALHRRRPAAVLGKVAKSEGAGTKAAFGSCKVEGRVMQLTCEVVVPTMAKRLKKFLKANKITLNVEILDADGNVLEADIEDLPDDAELFEDDGEAGDAPQEQADAGAADLDAQPAPQPDVPDAAALLARIKAAQPRIAAAPKPVADTLTQALKKVVVDIKAQNLAGAAAVMDQIDGVLARVAAQPAAAEPPQDRGEAPDAGAVTADIRALAQDAQKLPDPFKAKVVKPIQQLGALVKAGELARAAQGVAKVRQAIDTLSAQAAPPSPEAVPEPPQGEALDVQAEWEAAHAALKPRAEAAIAEQRFASQAVQDTFEMRLNYAEGSASEATPEGYAAALKTLPGLQKMLDEAAGNAAGTSGPEVGEDVQPFAVSRLKWEKTRETMHAELDKLKTAIATACKSEPGLADLADMVGDLDDYLKALDTRLIDRLDEVVNAPQGPEREARKEAARSVLAEYQSELQTDFFADVDGNNGFVNVSVAASASSALAEIAEVLAPRG
ncbi:hypothetical protein [Aquicoccus sp. SU-CL01552]|uniref:hypothetical protein n=1 Tax=Aquicoccus sp. SU-CL01552 TaxID=3127656 RepID=UPI003105871F